MGGGSFNGISARHLLAASLVLNVSLLVTFYTGNGIRPALNSLSFSTQRGGLTAPTSQEAATTVDDGRIINLDHGDPTMYEQFWRETGDRATIVIPGWQSTSYFSDIGNLCWFLEPELSRQIVRLHSVVGNAITDGRHIVVGTGSTQLFLAILYALCPQNVTQPVSVVSMAPFYSSYPTTTDCLRSGLYRWAGDAATFGGDGAFVELVTSPNNPDGFLRDPVVNKKGGILVHDLAYYWPQYTAVTAPVDHDISLFTVSKSTGHAGIRIGWALVKDAEVARKMTKFIELNSIGVSKDSQLRAAKIMKVVSDGESVSERSHSHSLFKFGFVKMEERWRMLREAVKQSGGLISLPDYPSLYCNFNGRSFGNQPAFAWVKCEGEIEDCEGFFREKKILTRSGVHFGGSSKYVRISMLDRDVNYNVFIKRLTNLR
ncbi:Tryptophan aminotransferase-related protein 2 [Linum grandiflorum]